MSRFCCVSVPAAWLGLFCVLAGCGGGVERVEVTPVRGKVLCQGQPVQGGRVQFLPDVQSEQGEGEDGEKSRTRGASGLIQQDGTFVLTTYESGDGAMLGRHRVSITPMLPDELSDEGVGAEDEEEDEEDERQIDDDRLRARLMRCPPPRDLVVMVNEGENVIQIEMSDGTVTRPEE